MLLKDLLKKLSTQILEIKSFHPIRVAIDGPCGAGKTIFADKLYNELKKKTKRKIIRIYADDFHNPKDIRYRQGRTSGKGYYEDAFNTEAILKNVLEPFGSNDNFKYKKIVLDLTTDAKIVLPKLQATQNAILIMDGVFLLRPELANHWDFKIFIDVPYEVSTERGVTRDIKYKRQKSELIKMYRLRYMEGFKIYAKIASPKQNADVVIDNSDYRSPKLA